MKFMVQIDQCQQCDKSYPQGTDLICSLSNKKENFYGDCKNFKKGVGSQSEQKVIPKKENLNKGSYKSVSHSNYSTDNKPEISPSLNGKTVLGIFMIIGAIIWFAVGYSMGIIFYYPPILLILGIISIVRGIINK